MSLSKLDIILSFVMFCLIHQGSYASETNDQLQDQTIVAKPERGFFLEPYGEFGQSSPTDGKSPRPSYGFGLNLGWMQANNLWTRLEPSFEIYSKAIGSQNRDLIVPIGGMIKIAYAYRISSGLYSGPAVGIGMGLGTYEETFADVTYQSSSSVPVQLVSFQYLLDFIANGGLSFRTGLKVSHYLASIDEVELDSLKFKRDELVHFNSLEIVFGLRFKFTS